MAPSRGEDEDGESIGRSADGVSPVGRRSITWGENEIIRLREPESARSDSMGGGAPNPAGGEIVEGRADTAQRSDSVGDVRNPAGGDIVAERADTAKRSDSIADVRNPSGGEIVEERVNTAKRSVSIADVRNPAGGGIVQERANTAKRSMDFGSSAVAVALAASLFAENKRLAAEVFQQERRPPFSQAEKQHRALEEEVTNLRSLVLKLLKGDLPAPEASRDLQKEKGEEERARPGDETKRLLVSTDYMCRAAKLVVARMNGEKNPALGRWHLEERAEAAAKECERLRAENESLVSECERLAEERAEKAQECERLRAVSESLAVERRPAVEEQGGQAEECERLRAQNEGLASECERLVEERAERTEELESLMAKHENLASECERLVEERIEQAQESERLKAENEALRSAREGSPEDGAEQAKERKHLEAEKKSLAAERQRVSEEREHLEAEKKSLAAERQRVSEEGAEQAKERERVRAEKESLAAERQRVSEERAEQAQERERLNAEKERLEVERQRVSEECERLRAEKESVASERQRVSEERDWFAEQLVVAKRESESLEVARVRTQEELQQVREKTDGASEEAKSLAEESRRLQQENEELQAARLKSAKEAKWFAEESRRLQLEHQEMQAAHSKAAQESEKLAEERKRLHQENDELQARCLTAAQDLNRRLQESEEMKDLNRRLQESEETKDLHERAVQDAESLAEENRRLRQEVEELKATHQPEEQEEAAESLAEASRRLRLENEELQALSLKAAQESKSLSEENRRMQKEKEELQAARDRASQESKSLSEENRRMQKEKEELQAARDRASQESAELDAARKKAEKELASLKEEGKRLQDENEELEEVCLKAAQENEEMQAVCLKAVQDHDKIFKLNRQITKQFEAEKQNLVADRERLSAELAAAKQEQGDLESELTQARADVQDNLERLAEASEENANQAREISALQGDKDRLLGENQRLTEERDGLAKKLAEAQALPLAGPVLQSSEVVQRGTESAPTVQFDESSDTVPDLDSTCSSVPTVTLPGMQALLDRRRSHPSLPASGRTSSASTVMVRTQGRRQSLPTAFAGSPAEPQAAGSPVAVLGSPHKLHRSRSSSARRAARAMLQHRAASADGAPVDLAMWEATPELFEVAFRQTEPVFSPMGTDSFPTTASLPQLLPVSAVPGAAEAGGPLGAMAGGQPWSSPQASTPAVAEGRSDAAGGRELLAGKYPRVAARSKARSRSSPGSGRGAPALQPPVQILPSPASPTLADSAPPPPPQAETASRAATGGTEGAAPAKVVDAAVDSKSEQPATPDRSLAAEVASRFVASIVRSPLGSEQAVLQEAGGGAAGAEMPLWTAAGLPRAAEPTAAAAGAAAREVAIEGHPGDEEELLQARPTLPVGSPDGRSDSSAELGVGRRRRSSVVSALVENRLVGRAASDGGRAVAGAEMGAAQRRGSWSGANLESRREPAKEAEASSDGFGDTSDEEDEVDEDGFSKRGLLDFTARHASMPHQAEVAVRVFTPNFFGRHLSMPLTNAELGNARQNRTVRKTLSGSACLEKLVFGSRPALSAESQGSTKIEALRELRREREPAGQRPLMEGLFVLARDKLGAPSLRFRWQPQDGAGQDILEDAIVRSGFCPGPAAFMGDAYGGEPFVFSLLETALDPRGDPGGVVYGCICGDVDLGSQGGMKSNAPGTSEASKAKALLQRAMTYLDKKPPGSKAGADGGATWSFKPGAAASDAEAEVSTVFCLITRWPLFAFHFEVLEIIRGNPFDAGELLERINSLGLCENLVADGVDLDDFHHLTQGSRLRLRPPRQPLCDWWSLCMGSDDSLWSPVSRTLARWQVAWGLGALMTHWDNLVGDTLARLLACALLEQKILLLGDARRTCSVALALRGMLWPFRWLHLFVSAPPPAELLNMPLLDGTFPLVMCLSELPRQWGFRTPYELPPEVVAGILRHDYVHVSPQLESIGGLKGKGLKLPDGRHAVLLKQIAHAKQKLRKGEFDVQGATEVIQEAIEAEVWRLAKLVKEYVAVQVEEVRRTQVPPQAGDREAYLKILQERCTERATEPEAFVTWLRKAKGETCSEEALPFYRSFFGTQLCLDLLCEELLAQVRTGSVA